MLKAISLHQPWAQFVALGWKTIETRSWGTPYRGRVAIHAAQTKAHILEAGRLAEAAGRARDLERLECMGFYPLGGVVAVATLVDCFRVSGHMQMSIGAWSGTVNGKPIGGGSRSRTTLFGADSLAREVPAADLVLGDLSQGRYGWVLRDVRPLREPVSLRGLLGLLPVPEHVERAIMAQIAPEGAARA